MKLTSINVDFTVVIPKKEENHALMGVEKRLLILRPFLAQKKLLNTEESNFLAEFGGPVRMCCRPECEGRAGVRSPRCPWRATG